MKLKWNRILLVVLVLAALVLVAGCSGEQTPYEKNDEDNYNISVKYDANGGVFTTSTTVIVDSYNPDELPKDENGMVQIALITPDDAARGNNAFQADRTGYFLAGWYAKCETAEDGTQTFAEPWDFANDRLRVDPKANNSASEPVLTLYAAWVPYYQVEIYDAANTDEPLTTFNINPLENTEIQIPQWNQETGALNMYKFPTVENKTFEAAYYDAQLTHPITDAVIKHPGSVDLEHATVEEPLLQIYVDMVDGNWFHIYNADQFVKNARLSGSYILHADLDFTDKIWPTALMYGNYTGTIQGNGHTISNVVIEQTNNSKINAGLFGALMETAVLQDVTFENVTFTITGTRVAGTSYGLLSGTVTQGAAVENVAIKAGQIIISEDAYFGTDDYVIGTVCGMGDLELEIAEISQIYEIERETEE